MESIYGEINSDENVIIDTSNISSEHLIELKNAINLNGLEDSIIFWP